MDSGSSNVQPEPEFDETSGQRGRSLGRSLLIAFVLAIVLATALTLIGDAGELSKAFRRFDWWLIAPVLALTTWNYGWRFIKWQMYLRELGISIPTRISARIFVGGFAMSVTPGKVGELIKAIYVRRLTGTPIRRTSAAIVAERITDAIAMLILAGIGALEYSYGRPFIALIAVVCVAGVVAFQRPERISQFAERLSFLPIVGRVAAQSRAFIEASGSLFRPPILVRAVGLGLISWSGECVAFFLVLRGLGLEGSFRLLLVATFILAVTSIAGGASLLPGGLGVADAGIAALLVLLVDDPSMNRTTAAAATLLIRFATLWFAVLLGAVALFTLERGSGQLIETAQPLQSATKIERQSNSGANASIVDVATAEDGGNS